MKIGIFGGTFNPIHNGHINSIKTVKEKFGLDVVNIVPNHQTPHYKGEVQLRPYQRIEMLRAAVEEMGAGFKMDDCEISRGGMSYSADTVKHFFENQPGAELFLAIGADQFEAFHVWKDFDYILENTNLIVTTRPGTELPSSSKDLHEDIAEHCFEFSQEKIELKSGKAIYFAALDDINISSTEVKEKIKNKEDVSAHLPKSVLKVITENNYYTEKQSLIDDYHELAKYCGQLLFDKKALKVLGKSFDELESPCDYAVIGSGTSKKHASSLAEFVKTQVKAKYGLLPVRVDGLPEASWVILDYGALMVHVFYDVTRYQYRLEQLWEKAQDLGLKDKDA